LRDPPPLHGRAEDGLHDEEINAKFRGVKRNKEEERGDLDRKGKEGSWLIRTLRWLLAYWEE